MPAESPSFIAGGDIRPCRFVKITDPYTVSECDADENTAGISQEGFRAPNLPDSSQTLAAAAGDPIHVYGDGEVCLLILAGSISAGQFLKSDADGAGVIGTSTDRVGAEALEDGSSGQFIRVRVWRGEYT